MPHKIDLQQNTPQWLEFRKSHIGASDAPIIMGTSPWKTAAQLLQEKLGLAADVKSTKAQQRGHAIEEEARAFFELSTGRLFPAATLEHATIPYLSASLDGLSLDGTQVLEIKHVNPTDHSLALQGMIPPKYYWQCLQQLVVSEAEVLHYLSYQKHSQAIVTLYPHAVDSQCLCQAMEIFWQELQHSKTLLSFSKS